MPKLPAVKPKQFVTVLNTLGFVLDRQVGSHAQFLHTDGRRVTVAMHGIEIPIGTLVAMLRDCQITRDTFAVLLKQKTKK